MSADGFTSRGTWLTIATLAGALGVMAAIMHLAPTANVVDATDRALSTRGDTVLYDGRPFTGAVLARFENGAPRESREFRGGREQGEHTGWWENGRTRFRYQYTDGVMDGDAFEWDSAGRPYRAAHYARGHEEGTQRLWNADGTVRASYVVRDGRRFGYIGSTGCSGETRDALPYYNDSTMTPQWLTPSEVASVRTHRIGTFTLRDQRGRTITADSLDGVVHVARFFFTRCGDVCPLVARQLRAVDTAFRAEARLRVVSYAVGGAADSVGALLAYAREQQLDPSTWWLLTGSPAEVARVARRSYLVGLGRGADFGVDSVAHTEMLVLVDRDRHVRGVYNGTLPLEVRQLVADARTLLATR